MNYEENAVKKNICRGDGCSKELPRFQFYCGTCQGKNTKKAHGVSKIAMTIGNPNPRGIRRKESVKR
jgi:hypothetical protein